MSAAPIRPSGGTASREAPPGTTAPPDQQQERRSGALAAVIWLGPVLVPAAVITALGLWRIGRDNAMGNDEVATRWAATLSLRELAHLLRHVDAVHGLYYFLMHAWVVTGRSPAALRVPSVIALAIGAALIAILARRLTGSGLAALFAGLVMALTPTISFYAQTARSYAMVLTCVVAATIALLRALDAEARADAEGAAGGWKTTVWRWLPYWALMALAAYLNELAVLALAAHGVTVLLARRDRRVLLHWVVAAASVFIVLLPLVVLSITQSAAVSWITRPNLGSVHVLFRDYFGPSLVASLILVVCVVVALLPDPAQPRSASGVTLASVAAPLLILPGGLLLAESVVARPLYVDRYVLYGEAGAALLAGGGMVRIGRWLADRTRLRALVVVPGVVAVTLALVLALPVQRFIRTPASRLFNFGGPSVYLAAHARPGDGILYFGTLFRKAQLGYPGDFTKVTDLAVARTPMQAGNFRGTDKPYSLVAPIMLRYQRIWTFGARPSATLRPHALGEESALLMSSFRLASRQRFHGITVTLWVRK